MNAIKAFYLPHLQCMCDFRYKSQHKMRKELTEEVFTLNTLEKCT